MSYKTIVVYLDSTVTAKALIDSAAIMAEKDGSHLIGLYVNPTIPIYTVGELPLSTLEAQFVEHYKKDAESIKAAFEQQTCDRPFVAEWRQVSATVSVHRTIADHARTADLLIVGANMDIPTNDLAEDRISTIITSNCRPTLYIPTAQSLTDIGQNVLIGWDAGDESTRAIHGALSLLKDAQGVEVLHINPSDDERHHTMGSASEMVATLARHDINAELLFSACSHHQIANTLLRTATEQSADMLVMGAYGHNKIHDFFLGSVTRDVIKQTKIPILMSH